MGAMALAVVAAIIIACTKEKETKMDQSSNEMTTVSKEGDMSAYLKHFKEKMQSAEKGAESLSLEDACWHLEAVLNYTYGDAGYPTSDIQCDTFCCKLNTEGEDVCLASLNEVYTVLSKNVERVYASCAFPDKSILSVQTLFEDDRNDAGVIVRAIVTTRGRLTTKIRFDSTDYWSDYYNEDWHYNQRPDYHDGKYWLEYEKLDRELHPEKYGSQDFSNPQERRKPRLPELDFGVIPL